MMTPMMKAPTMKAHTKAIGIFHRRKKERRGVTGTVEEAERGDSSSSSLTPKEE